MKTTAQKTTAQKTTKKTAKKPTAKKPTAKKPTAKKMGGKKTGGKASGKMGGTVPLLSRRAKVAFAALGLPTLLLALFVGAWFMDTRDDGLVSRGVSLAGRDLAGSTEADLQAVVRDLATNLQEIPVQIIGPGDLTMATTADRLGLSLDEDATVQAVVTSSQKKGGILAPFRWLQSFRSSTEVDPIVRLDTDRAQPILDEVADLVFTEPGPPTMTLEGGRLAGVIGQPGTALDTDALVESLNAKLPGADTSSINLIAPLRDLEPATSPTELQLFVDELNGNTLSPLLVKAGSTSRSFEPAEVRSWLRLEETEDGLAATLDDDLVQDLVSERFGDVATLPDFSYLSIVDDVPTLGEGAPDRCCGPSGPPILQAILDRESQVTLPLVEGGDEALAELGLVELVGEFTTDHPAGQSRVVNIQRMADMVRGVVVEPGESFSINDHIGRRTIEKGYVEAGVINYGVLDLDVGGGVSQFATTMFNAAFYAGFDIDDYQMHSLYFSRYPYGREATLSFPQIDLVITNPSEHHFLIWPEYTDTSITVKLFGTVFAEVEDLGTSTFASGLCSRATTTRQRTFLDGTKDADEFSALYQPEEGLDCNGNSTVPEPDCFNGEVPVDNDNDGRNESCGPPPNQCPDGEPGFDSTGDGFVDFCQAVSVTCDANSVPVDLNGDGINESCGFVTVACDATTVAVDTNGDGINDACQPLAAATATPAPAPSGVSCQPGGIPVDTDGDGVTDACQVPTCPDGYTLTDTNSDNIGDQCIPNQ